LISFAACLVRIIGVVGSIRIVLATSPFIAFVDKKFKADRPLALWLYLQFPREKPAFWGIY
jgi:hypothetical protein